MKLSKPFVVTPSLLPGLRIGNAWLECVDGYAEFRILFHDGTEFDIEDFSPGAGMALPDSFGCVLGFIGTWAYAVENNEQYPDEEPNEHAEWFPVDNVMLKQWALGNRDEIEMLCFDLENGDNRVLITD